MNRERQRKRETEWFHCKWYSFASIHPSICLSKPNESILFITNSFLQPIKRKTKTQQKRASFSGPTPSHRDSTIDDDNDNDGDDLSTPQQQQQQHSNNSNRSLSPRRHSLYHRGSYGGSQSSTITSSSSSQGKVMIPLSLCLSLFWFVIRCCFSLIRALTDSIILCFYVTHSLTHDLQSLLLSLFIHSLSLAPLSLCLKLNTPPPWKFKKMMDSAKKNASVSSLPITPQSENVLHPSSSSSNSSRKRSATALGEMIRLSFLFSVFLSIHLIVHPSHTPKGLSHKPSGRARSLFDANASHRLHHASPLPSSSHPTNTLHAGSKSSDWAAIVAKSRKAAAHRSATSSSSSSARKQSSPQHRHIDRERRRQQTKDSSRRSVSSLEGSEESESESEEEQQMRRPSDRDVFRQSAPYLLEKVVALFLFFPSFYLCLSLWQSLFLRSFSHSLTLSVFLLTQTKTELLIVSIIVLPPS